jgi:zinc transporter, ZIP family
MAVVIAIGAFLMTLFGGWMAQRVKDGRHLLLGLAGGLMLGVVGLDLLPEAISAASRHILGVPLALLLFVAGFLVAHTVERLIDGRRSVHGARSPVAGQAGAGGEQKAAPLGLIAASAMVCHSVADGIALGAAFTLGGGIGVAVACAVIAHDFADGFNTYTITRLYGNARRRAMMMLFADAAAPVAGAACTQLFTFPVRILDGYLGFFGGVLLYLAAAEILPEAHHEHPGPSTLLCTVLGVLFIWAVVAVAE